MITKQRLSIARTFLLVLGEILLLELGLSSPSKADFFIHSWEDHFEPKSKFGAKFGILSYQSSSNYDRNSFGTSLVSASGEYSRLQSDLSLQYGVTDVLTLYGRLSWASIHLTSLANSSSLNSKSGFADQTVGAAWRLYYDTSHIPLRFTSWTFQFQTDLPAYRNSQSTQDRTPYLGDGTFDFTGGFFSTFQWLRVKNHLVQTQFGAGYTYRTAGFSTAIPWTLAFNYQYKPRGFFGDVFFNGLQSLHTDSSTRNNLSTSQINTGTAGNYFTFAVNPSLIQMGIRVGYEIIPDTALSFTFSRSTWGDSSPYGTLFAGFIQTRFGKGDQLQPQPPIRQNSDAPLNGQFSEYVLEAQVLKTNDRLNLVKINKGGQDGIEVGQVFDIFSKKGKKGSSEVIARGRVISVKPREAAIEITHFFKEEWIEEGFFARLFSL